MSHLKKHTAGSPEDHDVSSTILTASGSVTNADYTVALDGSSAAVTATMPVTPDTDRRWNIVCVDSTNICKLDFNGKNFYNSSDDEQLFIGENLLIQYDGTKYIGA